MRGVGSVMVVKHYESFSSCDFFLVFLFFFFCCACLVEQKNCGCMKGGGRFLFINLRTILGHGWLPSSVSLEASR